MRHQLLSGVSHLAKEWFTAAEIAGLKLPEIPTTESAVLRLAKREGWRERLFINDAPMARRRKGRGGGWEYHYTILPHAAQKALVQRETARKRKRAEEASDAPVGPTKGDAASASAWAWFERLPEHRREKARKRLIVLDHVEALVTGGHRKNDAVHTAACEHGASPATVYSWFNLVAGKARADWLPALAPRHVGKTDTAACSPEAWAFIKGDWLRPAQPPFEACYDRLVAAAAEHGWTVPSARTLRRRIQSELGHALITLARKGVDEYDRLYPAQERDRTDFHAMQAISADYHKADVFVRMPDKKVVRPQLCVIHDLYSNKILAWRVDLNPSAEGVRLALYDVYKTYGIPEEAWLDNGHEFASKQISGGQKSRFRFKVKPGEMHGCLTALGTIVHWARVGRGQSKPIERSFKEFCERGWTHPVFEGAYTGRSPDNKPANYGSRAVDWDVFVRFVGDMMTAFNARPNRGTKVCGGVMSFDQAFEESYGRSLIRKATAAELRLAMLAVEQVTARKPDGAVYLMGNRYWAGFLNQVIGQKVTVRYDPDDLHAGVHVYRSDGALMGFAECWGAVGFADAEAGRAWEAKKRRHQRLEKELLAIERSWKPSDLLAYLPESDEAPEPPETKLIRPVRGNAAIAATQAPQPDSSEAYDDQAALSRFMDAYRRQNPGLQLVQDEDE